MSLNDLWYKCLDLWYRITKQDTKLTFLNGRSFRSFKELNIPSTGTYVVKIVTTVPVYFTGFDIAIDSGFLKIETVVGGTAGGTFSETYPIIKTNLATATPYVSTTSLTAGGTLTGGTVIDVIRQKTDGNATRAVSVISGDEHLRGIAPGTYYWSFTNLGNDAVTGTVRILWEEPEL